MSNIFASIERLAAVEAEIDRLTNERDMLRTAIRRYMEDTGKTELVDEINGVRVRLMTRKNRNVDPAKLDDTLLRLLANSQLIKVLAGGFTIIPPALVDIEETTYLRVDRAALS